MSNPTRKKSEKKFILPFSIPFLNRLKKFTKNMEMATVLYLAEGNREKSESHFLKKTDEKIVFITQACYPIWLIPYDTANLVFDGLGLVSHEFFYYRTPDVEVFNNDIRTKQGTTEAYMAALYRNIDYFRNFRNKERIRINGLITTSALKKDFEAYFHSMKELRKPATTNITLTPTIRNQEILARISQLSNLKKRVSKDIENVDASMKLLNATTQQRIRAIREDIKQTQRKYRKQIKKNRHKSTKRIRQIQNLYNRKITITSKEFNKRLLSLNKEQAKDKRTLNHFRREAKRCETKLKSSRQINRKQLEAQWNQRLGRIRKKSQALHKKMEVNSKRIQEIENAQKRELIKQKIQCLTEIESATKVFRDLQGSREAEIVMKRQEILTLEEVTQYITKSMQEMVQKKKVFNIEFDKITIHSGTKTRRLVYVPFYLVRYERGEKKRYVLYPPSTIGGMTTLTKVKGALGAAKVKTLLQPRSEAVSIFLSQVPTLLEDRPMLEKKVTEEGIQNSILLVKQLRICVKKGLNELKNENWISKNELETLSKLLYIYSSSTNRQLKTMMISENDYLRSLSD